MVNPSLAVNCCGKVDGTVDSQPTAWARAIDGDMVNLKQNNHLCMAERLPQVSKSLSNVDKRGGPQKKLCQRQRIRQSAHGRTWQALYVTAEAGVPGATAPFPRRRMWSGYSGQVSWLPVIACWCAFPSLDSGFCAPGNRLQWRDRVGSATYVAAARLPYYPSRCKGTPSFMQLQHGFCTV